MIPRSEQRVAETFVALADTLVDDFDVVEFLDMLTRRRAELLGISAAGVMLLDLDSNPQVAASSSERAELLELFAVQADDGPCIDCVRTGMAVASADLAAGDDHRWPRFTAAAHECGFRAVHVLPMRLRSQVVGALTLFATKPDSIDEDSARLGQAFADVATIGILQHRHIERGDQLSEQLQTALTGRVLIEQAKGVLAERGALSMDDAFSRLRTYARNNNLRLTPLARTVTDGTADLDAILAPVNARR
ncbi:MAG: GAF and ANTAR domain-containing protein [Actinomycetota bacterium]|nr:GAF and ANTAR domain-containing protein [Actinomycetota bacterium]